MKPIVNLIVSIATLSFSATLPEGLDGAYMYKGSDKSNCTVMPDLTIHKNYFSFGTVSGCEVKSVTSVGKERYSLGMMCASEGEESSHTSQLKMSHATLYLDKDIYERCPVDEKKVPEKECKVHEGQAGVTTFLDDQLKVQGSSVRDFDDYTFRATESIKVGEIDVLVGRLFLGDALKEPKSYAYSDEWECK